jgi:Fe-S-cluster-containing hydrogenase component 2
LLDVDDRTVKATVVATTRTEVIQLMNDDFWLLMKRHPEYQQKLRADMQEMRIAGQALQVMETKGPAIVNRMLQKGVFEGTDILLIDAHKCIRCDNCVKACASTHGGDSCVTLTEGSVISQLIVPSACRHCENPLCLTDCPPGDAIKRDARGIVYINEDKCIGCGNCAVNCPYGSITMRPRNPDRSVWSQFLTGVGLAKAATPAIKAVKCDLCREDAAGPACVRSCPTGAAIRVHPAEYFAAVGAGGPLGGMVGGSEVELKS